MPRFHLHPRRVQHEALQCDLFGPPNALRPVAMPTWQQLPEMARTMATRLIVRLLVEHAGSDLQSGSIGGRDDV
jgi:hypothetical protein